MNLCSAVALSCSLILLAPNCPAQEDWTAGVLFDAVSDAVQDRWPDRAFRRDEVPDIIEEFRPRAVGAASLAAERAVIHEFLSRFPASHCALYSKETYRDLMAGLIGNKRLTFGCTLTQLDGRYFVSGVMDGGAAEAAGLRTGDQIVHIDGQPVGTSPRLDWRSDDAWLPDPPLHQLRAGQGGSITLGVVTEREGPTSEVVLEPKKHGWYDASAGSAEVVVREGQRIGYVHLWQIHHARCGPLLERLLAEEFADCDAFVLDLRGRGGSAEQVEKVVQAVAQARDAGMKTYALIDSSARSAKDVIAWHLKDRELAVLVGKRSAGAVVPASFVRMPYDSVFMLPATFRMKLTGEKVEGVGVEPDIDVAPPGPWSHGADPIRERALDLAAERAPAFAPR